MGRNFRRFVARLPQRASRWNDNRHLTKTWRNEPPTRRRNIFSLGPVRRPAAESATTWTGRYRAPVDIYRQTDFRRDQSLYVGNSILHIRHRRLCARLLRRFVYGRGKRSGVPGIVRAMFQFGASLLSSVHTDRRPHVKLGNGRKNSSSQSSRPTTSATPHALHLLVGTGW